LAWRIGAKPLRAIRAQRAWVAGSVGMEIEGLAWKSLAPRIRPAIVALRSRAAAA
jgi:hypothetical protein